MGLERREFLKKSGHSFYKKTILKRKNRSRETPVFCGLDRAFVGLNASKPIGKVGGKLVATLVVGVAVVPLDPNKGDLMDLE